MRQPAQSAPQATPLPLALHALLGTQVLDVLYAMLDTIHLPTVP
jgi:hypothetical protein